MFAARDIDPEHLDTNKHGERTGLINYAEYDPRPRSTFFLLNEKPYSGAFHKDFKTNTFYTGVRFTTSSRKLKYLSQPVDIENNEQEKLDRLNSELKTYENSFVGDDTFDFLGNLDPNDKVKDPLSKLAILASRVARPFATVDRGFIQQGLQQVTGEAMTNPNVGEQPEAVMFNPANALPNRMGLMTAESGYDEQSTPDFTPLPSGAEMTDDPDLELGTPRATPDDPLASPAYRPLREPTRSAKNEVPKPPDWFSMTTLQKRRYVPIYNMIKGLNLPLISEMDNATMLYTQENMMIATFRRNGAKQAQYLAENKSIVDDAINSVRQKYARTNTSFNDGAFPYLLANTLTRLLGINEPVAKKLVNDWYGEEVIPVKSSSSKRRGYESDTEVPFTTPSASSRSKSVAPRGRGRGLNEAIEEPIVVPKRGRKSLNAYLAEADNALFETVKREKQKGKSDLEIADVVKKTFKLSAREASKVVIGQSIVLNRGKN